MPKTLPNELLYIPNADKAFHEKWTKNRNPLDFPHPFSLCAIGPVNSGKSTVLKNILIRCLPSFEKLFIIHCNGKDTKEYDDLVSGIFLDDFPDPSFWDGNKKKTMVIIDDVALKSLNKIQNKNLDRMMGYSSTHSNLSICICAQDAFQIPPIFRRMANIFVLWKPRDLDSLSTVARKSSLPSKEMNAIFSQLMTERRDSLWIDLTKDSPFPLRKNGFEIIIKTEESKQTKKEADSLDKFKTQQ